MEIRWKYDGNTMEIDFAALREIIKRIRLKYNRNTRRGGLLSEIIKGNTIEIQ
jgi:hypothetical protein